MGGVSYIAEKVQRQSTSALLRGLRRISGHAFFVVPLLLAIGVVVLPVIAIVARVPISQILEQFDDPSVVQALVVTLRANAIALALILVIGTPAGYALARSSSRAKPFLVALLEWPIVLPPAVAGVGLIATYGRFGLVGEYLHRHGVDVGLGTSTAVIIVVLFVASPFYVRYAISTFESIDNHVLEASRTLGASSLKTFFRVAVPLAKPGLAAGLTVAAARGVGEFGATIMFAGSLEGVTQTLSLKIYSAFAVSFDSALALASLLLLASLSFFTMAKLLTTLARSRTTASEPIL